MREWLRKWLGIERVEALAEGVRKLLNAELGDTEKMVQFVTKELENRLLEQIRLTREALADDLLDMRQGVVVEADAAVSCPEGHTNLIQIQVIQRTERNDTAKVQVTGGGYYCPTCGKSFYYAGGLKWGPKSDVPDSPESQPPAGPAPQKTPSERIRFSPRRARRT